jgi:hypothetical protein
MSGTRKTRQLSEQRRGLDTLLLKKLSAIFIFVVKSMLAV